MVYQLRLSRQPKQQHFVVSVLPLVAACTFFATIPSTAAFAEESTKPTSSRLKSSASVSFAPIRRLGVLPVKTNVQEWRRVFEGYGTGVLQPGAVLGMPLSSEQFSSYLSSALENVLDANGRFAVAALSEEGRGHQVEKDLDLDGLLVSEIRFDGDRAEIRIQLKARRDVSGAWLKDAPTLVRESLSLDLEFSQQDLLRTFSNLLARLVGSLGYLGQVTSLRDQIALVDFGREIGVEKGETLEIGLVLPFERHPVSGEVLRTKRVTFYEGVVTEARPGSSLIQLLTEDSKKILEFQKNKQEEIRYFVWRPSTSLPGSRSQQGFVDSGFKRQSQKLPRSSQDQERSEEAAQADQKRAKADRLPSDAEDRTPSEEESQTQRGDLLSQLPVKYRGTSFGLGMNFGTLSTDLGNRYTSFPSTLLNYLSAEAAFDTDTHLHISPFASVSSFSGGDVKGFGADVGALVLMPLDHVSRGFSAGGALHASLGSVKTIRVTQNLGHFSVLGVAAWTLPLGTAGKLDAEIGLSVFDLFTGSLGVVSAFKWKELPGCPKELGAFAGYERSGSEWSQIKIGALWAFGVPKK